MALTNILNFKMENIPLRHHVIQKKYTKLKLYQNSKSVASMRTYRLENKSDHGNDQPNDVT